MININKYTTKLYKDNSFNFNNNDHLKDKVVKDKATLIINHYFQKLLISKPIFNITHEKTVITIFYYMPVSKKHNKRVTVNNRKLNDLNILLKILIDKCFGETKLEIKLIQLHYPYLDSYIFSKYLAVNSMKYTFNRLRRKLLRKIILVKPDNTVYNNNNKGFITGIKIDIAGRLASHRIRPRTNRYVANTGTFKYNSSKSIIDYALYTDKNNSGAYSIKIWLSQKI